MGEATETKTPGRESQGLEKDLRRKISNLEATVARLTIERDDLSRDVETLCLDDSSNTTFNVSSVLNERIFVAGGYVYPVSHSTGDSALLHGLGISVCRKAGVYIAETALGE